MILKAVFLYQADLMVASMQDTELFFKSLGKFLVEKISYKSILHLMIELLVPL